MFLIAGEWHWRCFCAAEPLQPGPSVPSIWGGGKKRSAINVHPLLHASCIRASSYSHHLQIFKRWRESYSFVSDYKTRSLRVLVFGQTQQHANNCNKFMCFLQRMCHVQHFSVGIAPHLHTIVTYYSNIVPHIHSIVTYCSNIVPHIHGIIVHPVLPFCICLWPGSEAPLAHLKICKSFLSVLSDHKVLFDYDRWAGRCF